MRKKYRDDNNRNFDICKMKKQEGNIHMFKYDKIEFK